MKAARKHSERVLFRSTNGADIPVGLASRLWIKTRPGGIQQRVHNISEQFTGAGWKNLPQELVDEILDYLLDDLDALKACSITCKCLFGAARPLIHQRLVCLGSMPEHLKPKGTLFTRLKRDPGAFERLTKAERSGLLRYTRHLIIKMENGPLHPREMQEYLPHLRSITKLYTLTLSTFPLHQFVPVFNEYFGTFTNTLRHLDIRIACGTELQLLYIICQFPLLEDLTIICPVETTAEPGLHVPAIVQSPPLRGTLVLTRTRSRELFEGLAAFPGGLNCRSLELFKCGDPQAVFTACGHTAKSVSYLWIFGDVDSELDPSIHVYIAI